MIERNLQRQRMLRCINDFYNFSQIFIGNMFATQQNFAFTTRADIFCANATKVAFDIPCTLSRPFVDGIFVAPITCNLTAVAPPKGFAQ